MTDYAYDANTPLLVDLKDGHRYPIHIRQGVLGEAPQLLAALSPKGKILLVADADLTETYAAPLAQRLQEAGYPCELFSLKAGEHNKTWEAVGTLAQQILPTGIDRHSLLLALGGGIIGDMAGFTASVLLRGLPYVQIPTTLLAQVDSSVGGKTGVNTATGKNLLGSFYHPQAVWIDPDVLSTLPLRQRRAGYAEILKYSLINQPDLFPWLEANGQAILDGAPEPLCSAIAASCQSKADIVAQDAQERSVRALLNLGHTFGHAIEAEAGYDNSVLHGEAVAVGMLMALDLSVRLGLAPAADLDAVRQHLKHLGFATTLPELAIRPWPVDRLLAHMRHDKKVASGAITFVLLRGIGKAFLTQDVPQETLVTTLTAFGATDHVA